LPFIASSVQLHDWQETRVMWWGWNFVVLSFLLCLGLNVAFFWHCTFKRKSYVCLPYSVFMHKLSGGLTSGMEAAICFFRRHIKKEWDLVSLI
jgi:hypothetical protein